jgi:hypothetical protein
MRKAIAILWPSFLFGGLGAVLFFGLHDPVDLSFVGPLEFGRFFLFWGIAAGSSWLTCLLQHRTDEVNRDAAR